MSAAHGLTLNPFGLCAQSWVGRGGWAVITALCTAAGLIPEDSSGLSGSLCIPLDRLAMRPLRFPRCQPDGVDVM